MLAETSVLLLEGEALCQFMIYIIKIQHMDMNALLRQSKIASQDKVAFSDYYVSG